MEPSIGGYCVPYGSIVHLLNSRGIRIGIESFVVALFENILFNLCKVHRESNEVHKTFVVMG